MKPMKPMAPMEPMQPMKPTAPMSFAEPWWPDAMGEPASSGAQEGMRYAFFPRAHRLLVERDGKLTTYDSADHDIGGVNQQSGVEAPVFTSQHGPVALDRLRIAS